MLAAVPGIAGAAAGDLDPTFDGDGRRVLPVRVTPADMLVQPDGKIVLPANDSFAVMRLERDGSLDRGFGGDGIAAADFATGSGFTSAALQPDGKIVAAGTTDPLKLSIGVARFKTDGSLDRTFAPGGADGDGKRIYDYTELQPSYPDATVVQPDGSIVIVGSSRSGLTASRLTASGSPDGTIFDYVPDAGPYAATLAPDGALVVAGRARPWGDPDYDAVVARFSPEGSLDKSFAGTGWVKLGTDDGNDTAIAVIVQPDGNIVFAGDSGSAEARMAVTRLRADGTPDGTFGDGGTAWPDFDGHDYAAGAALQPDGKIVVAGTTQPELDFAVARLDTTGALDPSFGVGGRVTIPFEDPAIAYGAGLQPDGKIVVAGLTGLTDDTPTRTALARLLTDPRPGTGGTGDGAGDQPGGDGAGDQPGGGGPGPGAGGGDAAPVLSKLTVSPSRIAIGKALPRLVTKPAKRPTGTITFRLSQAANVNLRFAKQGTNGRFRRLTGRVRVTAQAGLNRIRFAGRLSRKVRLAPGAHRLTAVAVDARGARSAPMRRRFTAVKSG